MLGACPGKITDPTYVLTLSPRSATLYVEDHRQFSATLADDAGNPVDSPITWRIDNPSVAEIDANGLVRAVGPGTANVEASAQGAVASAQVTVAADTGQAITISPTAANLFVNATQQFVAAVTDRNGDTLTASVQWDSDAGSVARVSDAGLVTGVAAGTTTIHARARGMVASASVTVTARPSSAVLVGAGDIASCSSSGDEATAKLLDAIPGTVFAAGDLAYENGSINEFNSCYSPSWGRHKARTRPSPGNHEYQTFGASGYYEYFGAAAGDPDKGYYSYELGPWHIIVLNSNLRVEAGSPQEQWLREDLANSSVRCTLAYWHHPRFSSGADHGDNPAMQPLWQALYERGVEVVVSAHDHIYERFAPQTPAGAVDMAKGIRQFVVGTGGGSHDQLGTTSAHSEVRSAEAFGVLKLTLLADRYEWKFVPIKGETFTDQGSASCH